MKRKTIQLIGCAAVLMVVLIALVLPVFLQTPTEEGTFACRIVDAHGQDVHGYYSEKDEVWYLFVPSTEDLGELDVYVQGNVTKTSGGVLDKGAGMISAPFADSKELTLVCGGRKVQVVAKQSELPSMHIVLSDVTLDKVHEDKNEKYKGNSVYLSDPEGVYSLEEKDSVEVKGRGNSTWNLFDKKGYQIKFEEKTSVMGMGKAKKWVLLANASDDSMMRTQLTYRTASQMDMEFVPSFEYVDLWINGAYRGTYILGEKVELGGSRLDLEDAKGVLCEHDEGFYAEEDYWFLSDYLQRHFALKEYVSEDDETVVLTAMDEFAAAVDQLAEYLYTTPSHQVTLEALSTMIDVDSFVRYYLINEYVLNREAFVSSFYWYKDGTDDVIHLGPIWDFDTCMGNDGSAYTQSSGDAHVLFRYLLSAPEFKARALELKETYMPLFREMDTVAEELFREIELSAEMNYLRWDVLGKPNPKGGEDFGSTYMEAVDTLRNWLKGREDAFTIPEIRSVTGLFNEELRQMEICYTDDQNYEGICFAIQNHSDDEGDASWYDARKDADGVWRCTVDLSQQGSYGLYEIVAYTNDQSAQVAAGCCYVERQGVWIDSCVSDDRKTLELTLTDSANELDQVSFAVWSAQEDQDDLKQYAGTSDGEGRWTCTVDLERHGAAGLYRVDAYAGEYAADAPVAAKNVYVGPPKVTTQMSADGKAVTVDVEYVLDPDMRVWFAVWSENNGQDDLAWYEMQKQTDTTWSYTAQLRDVGSHEIHVYSGKNTYSELLAGTFVEVDAAEN